MRFLLNKWRGMHAGARASIVFALSSFILKGISFLTTPIFTRLLEPSHYGVIATYNSWLSIIEVFALLGLTSAGVFNVGLNDYKDRRDKYMSVVLTVCNLITIGTFAVIFVLKAIFGEDFLLPYDLLAVMMIYFIFSPATVFWVTRQRYEYKYKAAFALTVMSAIVSQGASVVAVMLIDGDPASVKIWSGVLAGLLFQIPIYIMLFYRGRSFFDGRIWKDVLRFALPLLPHYLAQHVMAGSDKIMISELYSDAAAGIYAVVANISLIATVVWSAVNASLIPFTFEKINDKKYKDVDGVVFPILLVYAVVCIGVALIAPEVLMILAPEEYYSGIYAVPPIIAVAFLSALYNVYANIEFYHKRSGGIAVATIVAASVNIALNYLLIPTMGFIGASYTTLASNVILVAMHYFGYRRCQKERVYNDKLVLPLGALCVLLCLSCNLLYLNNIVRYCVIGAVAVVVLIKHKAIIGLIKSLGG